MIMVDVIVPSIGRTYNFSLEENVAIHMLIAEISEVISQKENCVLDGKPEELTLCSMEQSRILSPEATLGKYGILNGNRLLLV